MVTVCFENTIPITTDLTALLPQVDKPSAPRYPSEVPAILRVEKKMRGSLFPVPMSKRTKCLGTSLDEVHISIFDKEKFID